MDLNINSLQQWYRTRLGKRVVAVLRPLILQQCGDITNQRWLVLGYGAPYLVGKFFKEAQVTEAILPTLATATEDDLTIVPPHKLPFYDQMFDGVLLVHALEHVADSGALLGEVQRVLKNKGQVVAVVPNRSGVWARREVSPFAHGAPYSKGQLRRVFNEQGLALQNCEPALFVPPITCWLLRFAEMFEFAGKFLLLPIAGVWLVNAKKDLLRGTMVGDKERQTLAQCAVT